MKTLSATPDLLKEREREIPRRRKALVREEVIFNDLIEATSTRRFSQRNRGRYGRNRRLDRLERRTRMGLLQAAARSHRYLPY